MTASPAPAGQPDHLASDCSLCPGPGNGPFTCMRCAAPAHTRTTIAFPTRRGHLVMMLPRIR